MNEIYPKVRGLNLIPFESFVSMIQGYANSKKKHGCEDIGRNCRAHKSNIEEKGNHCKNVKQRYKNMWVHYIVSRKKLDLEF
jgi:hypothetical protein